MESSQVVELVGTVTTVNGASWQWAGRRAPSLARKGAPRWGEPIPLFGGKDLTGWTFTDPTQAGIWGVEDGTLIKHGRGSEIVTSSRFGTSSYTSSSIAGPWPTAASYLRGRYEVQIETNATQESPNRRMGAVYGFIAPEPAVPRTPDVWHSYDITLVGRNGHRSSQRSNGHSTARRFPGLPAVPSTATKGHRVPYTCRALRRTSSVS